MKVLTVLGLGSCGISIIEYLEQWLESQKGITDFRIRLVKCDCDKDRLNVNFLKDCVIEDKINATAQSVYIENDITRGLGTSGNIKEGNAIYQKENTRKFIEALMNTSDKVIICGGLAGGFGGPVMSSIASEYKDKVKVVALYPSNFESKKRHDNAEMAMEKLKKGKANFRVLNIQDVVLGNLLVRPSMKNICDLTDGLAAKEIVKLIEEENY